MSQYMKRINHETIIGGVNLKHYDYKKLDVTKLTTEERLKVINDLLEGNTYFEELMEKYFTNMEDNYRKFLFEDYEFVTRLQAMTNYLLWSFNKEKDLEERIYENQFQLNKKHYGVYSLDGFIESNGRDKQVVDISKTNFKKEKELSFDQISKKQITNQYDFVKDYYDLIDYIIKHSCKVKRNSIKDDIVYVAEREIVKFKNPLKDAGSYLDLDEVSFSNTLIVQQLLRTPIKETYDLTNDLDLIQCEFNELYNRTELNKKQRKVIYLCRQQYTQSEIGEMLTISQREVSRVFKSVVDKIISRNKYEILKFKINKK